MIASTNCWSSGVTTTVLATTLHGVNVLIAPLYVVTGVLLLAGLAKVFTPHATATTLRTIGVPKPLMAARTLGFFEVVVCILAVISGHWAGWLVVGGLYAAFTVFVLWALQSDSNIGSCGCFGQEDTPPTPGHAAFNAAATAVAILAVLDPVSLTSLDGTAIELGLFVILVVTGVALSVFALTALPRNTAIASGTVAAPTKSFTMKPGAPIR